MTKKFILFLLLLANIYVRAEDKRLDKAEWYFLFDPEGLSPQMDVYDQNNAIIMGKLSYLAYYSKKDIEFAETKFQSAFPKSNVSIKFYDKKNSSGTQYIIFTTNTYSILSFRGTEFSPFKNDLYVDMKFRAYKNPDDKNEQDNSWYNMPSGHAGFRKALKKTMDKGLFNDLESAMIEGGHENWKAVPLYTCGHSLGAGLATLIIEPLKTADSNYSGTYTFSPPMSISQVDQSEYDQFNQVNGAIIHNIINYRDYVPRAGKTASGQLEHVGHYYRICLSKILVKTKPLAIKFYGIRKLFVKKYHSFENIIEYIQNSNNSSKDILERASAKCLCREDQNQRYSNDLMLD